MGRKKELVYAGRKRLQTIRGDSFFCCWQELHKERPDSLVRPYLSDLSSQSEVLLPSGIG